MTAPAKGIPRYRSFRGPAVFRQGFRPFFLGAGLWSVMAMLVWLPLYEGTITVPSVFDPIAWHAHEMLFGFVVAVIAGFLLTAIPNWTGRMPLQGIPLIILFSAWLSGRAATALSGYLGPGVATACDLAFLVLLIAAVLREIVAGRNWRNLPMPLALTGLFAANALMHADALGMADTGAYGERLGIAIVVLLIGLIGGRIVPSFTRNWLVKRSDTRLPAPFGRVDRTALGLSGAALVAWVVAPDHMVAGALLIAGGLAMAYRLARWQGHRTLAEPLVWSLHAGYSWVPIGLFLTGAAVVWPQIPPAAGLHALTAGAFGAMTLAVMTRATLGHTGQPLKADGWTLAIYLVVAIAAFLRVAAAFWTEIELPLYWISAIAWVAAFGLFSLVYGRKLLSG